MPMMHLANKRRAERELAEKRRAIREGFVGEVASRYESDRKERFSWKREALAVRKMLQGVTGVVLDCPIGTGRFIPLYARLGLRCIGVDLSADMLRIAAKKGGAVVLDRQDARALTLSDNSVSAVVSIRFFEHLESIADVCAVLEAFKRVCNGPVILSVRFRNEPNPRYTRDEFAWALEAAGYRIGAFVTLESRRDVKRYIWKLERKN